MRPSIVEISLQQLLSAKRTYSNRCLCCKANGIMVRCELPAFLQWLPVELNIYRCLKCGTLYRINTAEPAQ